MYIKKFKFENYGPIKNFEFLPIFKENGDPKPLVIIGKNGSGKTLMLSSILDSLIELKEKNIMNFLK